jgi:hypothetical protein
VHLIHYELNLALFLYPFYYLSLYSIKT